MNLATTAEPLRRCTRVNTEFEWGREQAEAFQELKNKLTNAQTLAIFDNYARTAVIADASPVGLGAILFQKQGEVQRVISYASRTLSAVERRYSQTEKEALALVWACERFAIYLIGREFDLLTDHKPLEIIYGPRSKPSARIERWVLRLQSFDFTVRYRPGKYNIADSLSRLPTQNGAANTTEAYVRFVATQATPGAMTTREIEEASSKDETLQQIREAVQQGKRECVSTEYLQIWDELTVIGHVILRGCRIVIPQTLRQRVLQLAHEGHQGIVKCKERLRSKVWWPGIDKEMERVCRTCHGCQVTQTLHHPPMKRTELPSGPWINVAADLLGPLPSGEHIFVVVYYYSRFFEIEIMKSIKATDIIRCLAGLFARYGMPETIVTDNGPQFVDRGFDQFLRLSGVEHIKTPQSWPRANGEVERQNKTLFKALRIAHVEGRNWKDKLHTFLLSISHHAPHNHRDKSIRGFPTEKSTLQTPYASTRQAFR